VPLLNCSVDLGFFSFPPIKVPTDTITAQFGHEGQRTTRFCGRKIQGINASVLPPKPLFAHESWH
jgi:hypothetical protein